MSDLQLKQARKAAKKTALRAMLLYENLFF